MFNYTTQFALCRIQLVLLETICQKYDRVGKGWIRPFVQKYQSSSQEELKKCYSSIHQTQYEGHKQSECVGKS